MVRQALRDLDNDPDTEAHAFRAQAWGMSVKAWYKAIETARKKVR